MVLQPLFVHGFFDKFAQKKIRSYFAPKEITSLPGEKKVFQSSGQIMIFHQPRFFVK